MPTDAPLIVLIILVEVVIEGERIIGKKAVVE